MAKCLSYLVFALCLFLWDFSFSTAEGDMACMPSTTIMEAGDGGETDTKYCGQDKEIRAGFGWGDIGYALLSCPIGHSIQAMRSFKGHTACAGWKMVCGGLQPCGCRREERNSRIHRFPAMPNYILYIR